MTHAHRKRRGVTPRPGEKDLRLLRRLATRARDLAVRWRAGSAADAGPLITAAAKAGKAILPVGHQNIDSPFVVLILLVEEMAGQTEAQRRLNAARLADLAAACFEALEAPATRPGRKDIDG